MTLKAVAEGVPLGRGWTRTYSPDDAPDLLTGPDRTGPDALAHPQWDQSGRQPLVLRDLEERVHVAVPRASLRADMGRYAPLRLVVAGVSRTVRARYCM